MSMERITATYWVESPSTPQRVAEVIAGEQSTGTFIRVPGETDELRERFGARIDSVEELAGIPIPSLPHARSPSKGDSKAVYRSAKIVLSWPLDNMGASLPNVLATVAGNLFELKEVSGLRLMDLDFPPAFAREYPGPRCGIAGTRLLANVHQRPLIGTIVKPSIGLTPGQTASFVRELVQAGIDFVKDDELMGDPPHSPFRARVDAVMNVINDLAQRSGRKAMYAFNLTGEIDEMCRRAEYVAAAGGTCVMVSVNSIGLPAVTHLRKQTELAIHAHRNGWGYLTRYPALGFDFLAWHKLWRLAGVDHLHTNGIRNKFWEPDESVVTSARACLEPMLGGFQVMPVLSSGQWAEQAPDTLRQIGSVDLMYLCGGGIVAHPDGLAAGLNSVRQAWDAAMAGIPLANYAAKHPELRRALEHFKR